MPAPKFLSMKNELGLEQAATALVMCDSDDDAVEILRAQNIITTAEMLKGMRTRNPEFRERYEKRRQELAPQREAIMANNLLDLAHTATLAGQIAVDKTRELLEQGKVQDPARVARDLSQVATQAVDKRLAVQGRPTQIIERRTPEELVRALIALGVAEELVEGTVTEDDADVAP